MKSVYWMLERGSKTNQVSQSLHRFFFRHGINVRPAGPASRSISTVWDASNRRIHEGRWYWTKKVSDRSIISIFDVPHDCIAQGQKRRLHRCRQMSGHRNNLANRRKDYCQRFWQGCGVTRRIQWRKIQIRRVGDSYVWPSGPPPTPLHSSHSVSPMVALSFLTRIMPRA